MSGALALDSRPSIAIAIAIARAACEKEYGRYVGVVEVCDANGMWGCEYAVTIAYTEPHRPCCERCADGGEHWVTYGVPAEGPAECWAS